MLGKKLQQKVKKDPEKWNTIGLCILMLIIVAFMLYVFDYYDAGWGKYFQFNISLKDTFGIFAAGIILAFLGICITHDVFLYLRRKKTECRLRCSAMNNLYF